MKPYCIHYSDRREVMPILAQLPKDGYKVLDEHNSWMIIRLPGLAWDAVREMFKGKALVGICEQKEYWTDDDKTPAT